jgi:hypothetical protein
MADARFDHTATLLPSGELLVAGGTDNAVDLASAELYDPNTGTWRLAPAMAAARWRARASALPDGQVLVTGGMANGAPLASAERYANAGALLQVYLQGAGSTANPNTLFLDPIAPNGETAKYKDSARLNFAAGNPWVAIGTWTDQPPILAGTLAALTDLRVWVGLKNSDDIGTQFDLLAEVSKNGTVVTSGVVRCVTGITRNPALAKTVRVSFDPFSALSFDGTTETLSLTLRARIGTNPDETKCSGPGGSHNNAAGLRLYFDGVSTPSEFGAVLP